MRKTTLLSLLILLLSACSPLSESAKRITGHYVIPELSAEVPVLELEKDGTCTVRAIRPGVLQFSVKGEWNVEGDMLTAILERETLECEGDSTLIGEVPETFHARVVDFNGLTLKLDEDGVTYMYYRQNRAAD